MNDIDGCADSLFAEGKGLLAADESTHSADKRLAQYGIGTGEEMRRKYRELFLDVPGVERYLSGVILFTEQLPEKADTGDTFPALLAGKGIVPGVKVDLGTEPMAESPDELITNGLIGLPERLAQYRQQGARFTKWRAGIRIDGDRLPSNQAILENARRLAGYARAVQEAGMVPIIEPEVLLEGNHSRLRAREVITQTLTTVFNTLEDQAVDVSAVILKTAMALSGSGSGRVDTPEEVAEDTVAALMQAVPPLTAGVVFLSGGQTPDQATDNLRAIVRRARGAGAPWPLTFSYARALQEEALALWKGEEANVPAAREAYLARLAAVSAASRGE